MKTSKSVKTFDSQKPKASILSSKYIPRSAVRTCFNKSLDITEITKDQQGHQTDGPTSLINQAFIDSSVITEKPNVSKEFQYLLKISDDLN